RVLWNGAPLGDFAFDSAGRARWNMGWEYHDISLIGTGLDRLEFQSLTPGKMGPALDDVSLTPLDTPIPPAAPEPGSLALLATGGMPLIGFLRRRKVKLV